MNETAEKFIAAFHSLNGTTIDERKKNLSLLLKQHSFLAKTEDLNIVIENLRPQSHLERIFWVELLIRFKRFDELLTEFKNGNEMVVSKISKERWFFERYFSELQPETFVYDVLPTMSYVLRLKILKKLILPEEQVDQVFDAVHDKYGLLLATSILHKCTISKIKQVLQNDSVSLTPRQLKCIVDKDSDLLYLYIEERKKTLGSTTFLDSNPFLVYVAQTNPDLFGSLYEKYKFNVCLGNKTTKKFVQVKKDAILAKPKKYVGWLRASSLVRKLGSDFKTLLVQLYPEKTLDLSTSEVSKLLKCYPRKGRFDLYRSIFDELYFHKFGHNTDLITEDVLELIFDNDEREHWAKIKYQERNDEDFLQYYKAENCLEILLPKLNHSNLKQREFYIRTMTKSCILSRDLDSLQKVAKLVAERFRNDQSTAETFIITLEKKRAFLAGLTPEIWELVKEPTFNVISKNEYALYPHLVLCRYFEFLRKNSKPLTDTVARNPVVIVRSINNWYKEYNQKLLKVLLEELLQSKFEKPGDMYQTAETNMELATQCLKYNKKNRKDQLKFDIWQDGRLMKSCKHLVEGRDLYSYTLWKVFCSHTAPQELDQYFATYLKGNFRYGVFSSFFDWLLKYKPHLIMENLEPILDEIFNVWGANKPKLWNTVKKYSNLQMDQKVVDFYLGKLREEDYDVKKKESCLLPLSILMLPEEFVKLAQTYKPISGKAPDLNDDAYKIQCKVVHNLKNSKIPEVILPTTLDFCTGDYLRFALRPLYSAIYRMSSGDVIRKYLAQINSSPSISVKKHHLYLTCLVLDSKTALECLKTTSILSVIPAVKYFRNNPSQESWEIAVKFLKKINNDGANTLTSTLELNVPFNYKEKYFELLSDIIDSLDQTAIRLQMIPKISYSQNNLAVKIMRTWFLKTKHQEIDQFVADFLSKSPNPSKFSLLSNALSDFKTAAWNVPDQEHKSRQRLSKFVQLLFKTFMKNKETSLERQREEAVEIAAAFNKHFQPSEAFDVYVMVYLLKLKKLPVPEVSKSISELSGELVEMFGNTVVFPLASQLKQAFVYLLKRDVQRFELCHQILELGKSVEDDLLVVKLLPGEAPDTADGVRFYQDTLAKLRAHNNSVVNLHLSLSVEIPAL